MHASVDVFWSRGYEQRGLCSRLYFNAEFTLLCLGCVEMLKWLTLVDFVNQSNSKLKSLRSHRLEICTNKLHKLSFLYSAVLVYFSCIGFHCIYSLFYAKFGQRWSSTSENASATLGILCWFCGQNALIFTMAKKAKIP